MHRLLVGTAGHIDHGKTRLVQALTGIDCDRLAEEKARGITIDIGFAHFEQVDPQRGDVQIGFVDVPGHERFLHNALAGLGGIRAMLLVVAADEGVKPQTREHLAICALLGIPHGVVALTKTDLAAPDLVELAEIEVAELLEETPFRGAPIFRVASPTGAGIVALRAHLVELARQVSAPAVDRPARLPVDRAFHLKGLGVVATGTLAAGALRPGDALELLPSGKALRVRSVQVHGHTVERAVAGERVALQLAGAELAEIERGMTLGEPGAFAARGRWCARVELLADAPAPLRGAVPLRLHLYSAETMATLRPLAPSVIVPGQSGLVELRLKTPLAAARGDRFVLRRPSPQATIGGGEVLDPDFAPRRGARAERAAELAGTPADALLAWAQASGEKGVDGAALARRLGVAPAKVASELTALVAAGKLLALPLEPPRWIAPQAYQRVAERARAVLADFFRRERLARGMSRAEAVRRILPGAPGLADVYFAWLRKQGVLGVEGDLVTQPGRGDALSGEESQLARDIAQRFEAGGLQPPSPGEVAAALFAKPQIVDGVLRYLVERGKLVRLPGGLMIGAGAIAALRQAVLDSPWERFTVPQFKERFGLSRKWAIPLLEHLDSTGTTRRLGEERAVVRR